MPMEDTISTGVALRVDNGFFRVFPYENPTLVPFEAAVRGLNPVVAVKLRSSSVLAAMAKVSVFFCPNICSNMLKYYPVLANHMKIPSTSTRTPAYRSSRIFTSSLVPRKLNAERSSYV